MIESPPATPRFLVRELSHVEFVRRVLAQAERKRTPLLERVRYIAIVSDLIDELFQVRLTDLEDKVDAGFRDPERGDKPAHELLNQIREVVIELDTRQSRIFRTELGPALEDLDIRIRLWDDLDETDRTYFHQVFHDQVFPVLTPLAVDPAHPFPYISNLSMNLAVMVKEAGSGVERFARVKVPPILPRFIELPNRRGFLPLEQLISAHIDELFPGMQVSKCHPFRLTRNTDYELAEFEASDLMAALKSEIGRRRQGQVMRLEVERDIDPDVLDLLMRELEIKDRHVYRIAGLLGLGSLTTLADLDLPEHRWKVFPPAVPPRITAQGSFFDLISEGDFLVHHPYESFAASTAEFVHEAAHDPNVLGIKQTLYRTSSESSIARSLITAAELGKQVVALVELKARFEEQRNIERALALEEAGVHVVYGLVGLKTHAKLCLVVRQEKGGLARYVHTLHRQLQRAHRPSLRGRGPVHQRSGNRCRCERPVQPYDRLQPTEVVPQIGGGSHRAARPFPGADPPGSRPRRRACGCQDERLGGQPHHQRPLRGLERGHSDRSDRQGGLLPPAGCPRVEREHHGALHCGAVPGAFPHFPGGETGAGVQVLHGVGRSYAPQPG